MIADRETHILISDEGLFPAEYIYPSDDLFPEDPSLRQVSNIVAGSLKLDELISENIPQFGQMFASKFECTVYLEEDLSGKFIHVYQVKDGVSSDVFAGKIDSCKLDKVGTDRKLIAYDLAYERGQQNIADWWERFWYGRQTATLKQVRESLLSSVGLVYEQVELPNDNMTVTKTVSLTSCTMTAMLRMICELNYCFPHLDRTGYMTFIMLNTEPDPEDIKDLTNQYEGLNSTFEDFTTSTITGVQFYDSDSELKYTYGATDNAYPIKQNIFLYDRPTSVLDTIGRQMMDYFSEFSYTPATVKMIIGEMDLQLGDYVHTEKGDFYVMENSYSGSQFFEQTIRAKGQELLYGGTPNFDYNEIILSEKIARVRQTVEAFEVEYADFKEDTQANFEVTADSISSEVSRAQRAESSLSSQIQQTAESIHLNVTNGSTSSTIKLYLDQTELSSNTIQMNGLVKFTDLSTSGSTTINGSNITTGTINASVVNVTNINASNITSGTLSADRIQGGKLRISDAGSSTKAILVQKSGNDYITIDADDGIVVSRSRSNSTKISDSGISVGEFTSWNGVNITGGTSPKVSVNGQHPVVLTGGSSGNVSCYTLTVNSKSYSGQLIHSIGAQNNGAPGIAEVKAFDIDSTINLYAVQSSTSPSMKGNSTNGYNFSSSPTWKKISLKQVSYSTKIYGLTGTSLSVSNKTVLSQ